MEILAISGWKASGKDTIADDLVENHNFTKLSFAGSLKDLVANLYGIPRSYFDDRELKEKPLFQFPVKSVDSFGKSLHNLLASEFKEVEGIKYWTPRALCILEGSTKRSVNSSFWVRKVIDSILELSESSSVSLKRSKFVISDLRYRSEINQLRDIFGDDLITARVNRFDESTSDDPSERDLDDHNFELTIDNKGTKEDLHSKLEMLFGE